METVIRIHNESEYNEILQQAVEVIEIARGNLTLSQKFCKFPIFDTL